MQKFQEVLLRVFLSVVISAVVFGPLTALVLAAISGVDGSQRFIVAVSGVAAVVLYFTPWTRDTAKDWVEEMAVKEAQRVAELKRQNEWAKQERAKVATMRNKAS